MARNNRPGVWIQPSMRDKSEWREFKTYRELKKNIRSLIEENQGVASGNEITVFRSRRGNCGEWYEKWSIINGKPKCFEKGWM